MTSGTFCGNRRIYEGAYHIWAQLIGFHGNIPRWGILQLGIILVSSDLVFFSIN